MAKYKSNWIERDIFYRQIGVTDGAPHYQTYQRPVIVCLCGSTRFMEAWQTANLSETLAGRIVLSIGCNTKDDADLQRMGQLTAEKKAELDALHLEKINLADEVLVLNCKRPWCPKCEMFCKVFDQSIIPGGKSSCCCAVAEYRGYIGDSTRREVLHAEKTGKTIRWLEPFSVPPDLAHLGDSLSDGPLVHRDRDNDPDYVGA